jgi:hypothetical protein
MAGIVGVLQDGDPRRGWNGLLQQLQPLARELARENRQAGDVAARPREVSDEAVADRIADRGHDDRNTACRRPRGADRRHARRDDDIDLRAHKVGDRGDQSTLVASPGAEIKHVITTFDIAEIRHAAPERLLSPRVGVGSSRREEPDPRDLARLLRRDRRSDRCREQDDREEAPENRAHHSITSSARARSARRASIHLSLSSSRPTRSTLCRSEFLEEPPKHPTRSCSRVMPRVRTSMRWSSGPSSDSAKTRSAEKYFPTKRQLARCADVYLR